MFIGADGKIARLEPSEQRSSCFYHGVDGNRNGGGVFLKEEFDRNILEVKSVR